MDKRNKKNNPPADREDKTSNLRTKYYKGLAEVLPAIVPQKHCVVCPPMGNRVNKLLSFIEARYEEDPGYLDWLEINYIIPLKRQLALNYIKKLILRGDGSNPAI